MSAAFDTSARFSDTWLMQAHSALHQLAMNMSAVFSAAFLLRQGLTPAQVFLAFAAILALRFALRPFTLLILPALGMRRALIAGTALLSLQYAAISFVTGFDGTLAAFCAFTAFANMLYWTTYHPAFAAAGEHGDRGRQLGARQIFSAAASIIGPLASGLALTLFGPAAAFGAASVVTLFAILPLLRLDPLPVAKRAPAGAWSAARGCTALFATDGFVCMGAGTAWSLILFRGFGERFDVYGSALAAAGVAGALAGFLVGRGIDLGHGRRATWIAIGATLAVHAARALCGETPAALFAVTIIGTALGGFYIPTLMTTFYNQAKAAPCPFRFQYVAEGGWDAGGALACLIGAALAASGLPLQASIALALPVLAAQGWLLHRAYGEPVAAG